jgi:hypothetical protein
MNEPLSSVVSALVLALSGSVWVATAGAETPFEKSQREDQEHYQQQHGVSPQAAQARRWEQEWRQQHPNEPMPSFGALEKMHRQEIIANTNRGFAAMRKARQQQLQREYLMARQLQQRQLDARHVVWSPQQWHRWDQQYEQEHQQAAQALFNAQHAGAGGSQFCAKGIFNDASGGCIGESGKILEQNTGKPIDGSQ